MKRRMTEDKETEKIIKAVINGDKTELVASIQLCKTVKTVRRKVNKYKSFGRDGLIHRSRGRAPSNALDHKYIFDLYINKYSVFTITHFCEKLKNSENLSVSEATVRNIFKDNNIVSIKAKRKTKTESEIYPSGLSSLEV